MASVSMIAFVHILALHSPSSLHLASSSALVFARSTLLVSLWFQMDSRREPITHVNGNSREGSSSRSSVSILICSAPGWYPCRVLRSLAGSPWLASQLNRACSRVSGFLVWAV